MTTNVLDLLNDERSFGLSADVVQELGDSGQVASGENVVIYEAKRQ